VAKLCIAARVIGISEERLSRSVLELDTWVNFDAIAYECCVSHIQSIVSGKENGAERRAG